MAPGREAHSTVCQHQDAFSATNVCIDNGYIEQVNLDSIMHNVCQSFFCMFRSKDHSTTSVNSYHGRLPRIYQCSSPPQCDPFVQVVNYRIIEARDRFPERSHSSATSVFRRQAIIITNPQSKS